MSNLSDLPNAKWAPKPTLRFKTQLQAETALASTEESLRTQKAIADHLCVECAELRKENTALQTDRSILDTIEARAEEIRWNPSNKWPNQPGWIRAMMAKPIDTTIEATKP